MSTLLTLEIPDELARRARALAAAMNRRFEDAIVDWIGRAVQEPVVESLSDAELLSLCEATLSPEQQEQLSGLLAELREGNLDETSRAKLDELMAAYRLGLLRKAGAMREAVTRGLRPPLGEDAALPCSEIGPPGHPEVLRRISGGGSLSNPEILRGTSG